MGEDFCVVDLFCGAGGLTHGLLREGFRVTAGIDCDPACRYPYEHNNPGAVFIGKKIEDLRPQDIEAFYPKECLRILVGCAPCQPFSSYTNTIAPSRKDKSKWRLLYKFGEYIEALNPVVVSMENVPNLLRFEEGRVLKDFLRVLKRKKYRVSLNLVKCPDYGIPQTRERLVLLASLKGSIALISPTHSPEKYTTVIRTIGALPPLAAGGIDPEDPLHRAAKLSPLNLRRIRASHPNGTWRDWPEELQAACHKKDTGKTYPGVYGRMSWDAPSPTITTQSFGFGSGRFGHPEQDRALSLREAALLQTFPQGYEFVQPGGKYCMKTIGRLIGNAVPVELGEMIGKSIARHLNEENDRHAGKK
jgi:DNA (cytosine-5)-methyltransferase 1